MNKAELVTYIAEKTGTSKKDAGAMLDATIEGISETLKKGDKVSIPGFGSFEVRTRQAREGVNPATKEKMHIAASKSVKFNTGKPLKESLK